MLVRFHDFNGADALIAQKYQQEWAELEHALMAMPLHLKASDENGIQGSPIFDPIGTNQAIIDALAPLQWQVKVPILAPFKVMGKDIDFAKHGVLVEVQFSNYPFLINNVLRSEMFHKAQTVFHQQPTGLLIIVTKAKIFPASQSTLYFEQAKSHLDELAALKSFDVPLRLVSLSVDAPSQVHAMWTQYTADRHSRTIANQRLRVFNISAPSVRGGRSIITLA
jgi:hypothetical protein